MTRQRQKSPAGSRLDARLVLPAIAVWCGCLTVLWTPGVAPWVLLVLALLMAVLLLGWWRRQWHLATPAAAAVCAVAAIAITGMHSAAAAADPLARVAHSGGWAVVDLVVTGDVVAAPQGRWESPTDAQRWIVPGRSMALLGDDAQSPYSSRLSITVLGRGAAWAELRRGDEVRVRGSATTPVHAAMAAAQIVSRADPVVLNEAPWWHRTAHLVRNRLATTAASLSPDAGGLLRGLVVGDTRALPEDLAEDARTTGLAHLVAVSGTHMAIVGGAVLIVLRRFGPGVSVVGMAGTYAVLILLVGPAPSVVRSVTMAGIGLAGALSGRPRDGLAALCAAVIVMLLVSPELAVSAGFALSVHATAGIILLTPPLSGWLQGKRIPRGWAQLAAVPVAAHIATIPVIAAISGSVSMVAVPANIAVTPVVAPALLLGLAATAAGTMWPAAGLVMARLDEPLLHWIAAVAHHLARWRWASIGWSTSMTAVLALPLLFLVIALVCRHRGGRRALIAVGLGVVGTLLVAAVAPDRTTAHDWKLVMCDVGQGDGMVLATGRPHSAVVIDAGPDPASMQRCLDRLGVTEVPWVILTHLHADHIDGLTGVFRGRQVESVGVGIDRSSAAALATIAEITAQSGAKLVTLTAGDTLAVNTLKLEVLGPLRHYRGTDSDANNESLVIRAIASDIRILLTGDIERPAQASLLAAGVDLRADVLKQPHHGSAKLLPEFVAATGAQLAIIGVGDDNGYGHPAPSALQINQEAGIGMTLRTDQHGDLRILHTADGLRYLTDHSPQPVSGR